MAGERKSSHVGQPASAAGRPRSHVSDEDRKARIAAVLSQARENGLTSDKGGRISGRVSPALIERAKVQTGLRSDTELVEFALANIAVEDGFARTFRDLRGSVPADIDLDV